MKMMLLELQFTLIGPSHLSEPFFSDFRESSKEEATLSSS